MNSSKITVRIQSWVSLVPMLMVRTTGPTTSHSALFLWSWSWWAIHLLNEIVLVMIYSQHCQNWQVDRGWLSLSSVFLLSTLNPLCVSFEDLEDLKERCGLSFCLFSFLFSEDHSFLYHLIIGSFPNLSSSWGRHFIMINSFISFVNGQRDMWILGWLVSTNSALLAATTWILISGVPGLQN